MSRCTKLFLLISCQLTVGYYQKGIGVENISGPQILSKKASESRPYVPLNSLTTKENGSGNFFQWVYPGPSLLRQMLEEHNSNVRYESNSRPPEYHVRELNPIDSLQGSIAKFDVEKSGHGSLRASMSHSFDYERKYAKENEDVDLYINSSTTSQKAEESEVLLTEDGSKGDTLFAGDGLTGENHIPNLSKTMEEIISVDPLSPVNGNTKFNLPPNLPSKPEYSEDSAHSFNEYVFEHFNLKEQPNQKENNIINRFVDEGIKEQFSKLENNNEQPSSTESNIIWIYTTIPTRKPSNVSSLKYHFTTELPHTSSNQPALSPVFEDYFDTNTIIPSDDAVDRENANNLTDDANITIGAFDKPITDTRKPPIKMTAYDLANQATTPKTTTDTALPLSTKPFTESIVNDLSIHSLPATPSDFTPPTDVSDTTIPSDWFQDLVNATHNQDFVFSNKSEASTIASDFEHSSGVGIPLSMPAINIWNYLLKEIHKANQNNAFANVTITPQPIDKDGHDSSDMLYQMQFDENQNSSSSNINQPEETEDTIKESLKQPNETHFPNLYEFILHRIGNGSETVGLKLNQTLENDDGDNMEGLVVNHTLFTNETKHEISYQPISLGPSNHTANASRNTIVSNGSNEFESSAINGNLIQNQNKLPIQNIYQVFQENKNVNSNIITNLQNNNQIININNPLSSVPSSLLEMEENLENGTKVLLESDINNSNLPSSKPKETFFTSSKPSNISEQTDTVPLDEPSLISNSDIIQSVFPDSPSIPNEEVPIDLSSLLQENLPINNPPFENNVDILKNIDPETLVYEYIQRIKAASKLFNKNDLSNPEIQDVIQDIALELLLSYLMKDNNQPLTQPYKDFTTASENSDQKKITALFEELVYLGLGENKESPSRNPLNNISNINYNIISKLIEDSTTAGFEYPSFRPPENSDAHSLPNTNSANPETYLPNRDSLIEDLWQIFDKTIPNANFSKIEGGSDGLDNINYDMITDLAYYEYNNPNYDLINDFIGSESSDFADEAVTTRPSFFAGTIKNSLTSLTKMISDLVPAGVTYEWCINSRGCAFALAASLALSAIGATGALVFPSVIPFGRRKKQLNSEESRIFSSGSSNLDINEQLKKEFERILKELALNKKKRMSDNLAVHRTDIINHLRNEYRRILKWKKKTSSF